MSDTPTGVSLEAARQLAGLSHFELWIAYIGLGGSAPPRQLAAFLSGAEHPTASQHDVVAHALNERFTEMELNHPVPYSDDAG